MSSIKRPLMLVPIGLKAFFVRHAEEQNMSYFHEIREIDPTHPGLDEFEDLMREDTDTKHHTNNKKRAVLKLVVNNGLRID